MPILFNNKTIQKVLNTASLGMWVVELDEEKPARMYIDETLTNLLGISDDLPPQECYGIWYQRIKKEHNPIVTALIKTIISNSQADAQYVWEHPTDGPVSIQCHGSLDTSYKKGFRIQGYQQIIADIECFEEESKSFTANDYEALQKADQAKSEFLSRMSHDIRTPMNAIKGMTMLARRHINDKERLNDCLHKIDTSTQLMMQMVDEVLDTRRLESGHYTLDIQPFSMRDLINKMSDLLLHMTQEKNQILTIDDTGLIHNDLLGDTLRIQQVLMNVLTNAHKYTSAGGYISLKITETPNSDQTGGTFCFLIEDNGIGMDSDFLLHIFEPFSRAKNSQISDTSGTGLGMAIAHNIAQLMNGDIQVESAPNKGSRFTITLYLDFQTMHENEIILPKEIIYQLEDLHLEGKNILLVEDNEINMEIAKETLEISRANVETAENGKEALEYFLASPPDYYNAIFMDIQMPVMGGNEATSIIRSLDRPDAADVPIIAMTANVFKEDILLSKEIGMNEYMTKPIDVNQLAAVLKKWC